MNPPSWAIHEAIQIANSGPCQKSQRGVVIFDDCEVLSRGHNRPPKGFTCNGSKSCEESCAKICRHAEIVALSELTTKKVGLEILHIKTVKGLPKPSKNPSCWQCSREILDDSRISWFWLLEENGWIKYSTIDFHEKTLKICNLPIIKS